MVTRATSRHEGFGARVRRVARARVRPQAAALAPSALYSSSGIYRTKRERRANIPLTTVRIGCRHDVEKRGFSLPGAAPKGRDLKSIGAVPKTSLQALRALAGSGTPRMTAAWASPFTSRCAGPPGVLHVPPIPG